MHIFSRVTEGLVGILKLRSFSMGKKGCLHATGITRK